MGWAFLHRDYLGSILAITDALGTIVEERQFGAWGTVDRFRASDGTTTFSHNSLLGRGYTGHEHFFEVGLIHMNGRMYDAQLGRFLSPDNYVQDPYNTQNFNRYGYVLNNPLVHNDPTGELAWFVPVIAAVVGAYAGGAQANGTLNPFKWDWKSSKTWAGIGGGALVGATSVFGGSAITGLLTASGATASAGAIAVGSMVGGAFSGAAMAALPGGGGKILQGALMGGASGLLGGFAGAWTSKHLGQVAINGFKIGGAGLKGIIGGVIGGAVGGYTGGFSSSMISGASFAEALAMGVKGAVMGSFIGGISGGIQGFRQAKILNQNGWNGKSLGSNSLGAGRSATKQWLQEVGTMDRDQMVKDIKNAGFELKTPSKSPVEVYERGGMRIRLDPIQRGTPYKHMHLEYGGRSFDTFLTPVDYRSPAAHIPIR